MPDNLSDLNLRPHAHGWSAPLPNAPRFFDHQISVDIHTRSTPTNPPTPPPITHRQAALVRSILSQLDAIVKQVERELSAYNQNSDPAWRAVICNPSIWLSNEDDDGESWTFVIQSTQNPDFGWHAEFKGPQFCELWSGD